MSSYSIDTKGKSTGRLRVLSLRHTEAPFSLFLLSLGSDTAQSFMMTSILARCKHYKKRAILLVLLATFSLNMKLNLFSLTQEASQLGWKFWDIFYTAITMPDWTTVDTKGFCVLWNADYWWDCWATEICQLMLSGQFFFIRLKHYNLHFTSYQLTVYIISGWCSSTREHLIPI